MEENGICSAAFCESAALREKHPLSLCCAKPAPPRGRLWALPETLPPPPKAVPLGKVASPQAMTEGVTSGQASFPVERAKLASVDWGSSFPACIPSSPAIPNLHRTQLLVAKLLSFSGKYCILVLLSASIACRNIRTFEKKHLSMQTRKRGQPL